MKEDQRFALGLYARRLGCNVYCPTDAHLWRHIDRLYYGIPA